MSATVEHRRVQPAQIWREANAPHHARDARTTQRQRLALLADSGIASVATQIAGELREVGVAAVAASAFCTDRLPPEGLRLCLGGGLTRDDCGRALQAVATALGGLSSTPGS